MSQNNTLLLLGAVALLASRSKVNGVRYPAKIVWNGWGDNCIGSWCYDWDYNVTVIRPVRLVDENGNPPVDDILQWNTGVVNVMDRSYSSSRALGYDYDASNSGSYETVLSSTIQYADREIQKWENKPYPPSGSAVEDGGKLKHLHWEVIQPDNLTWTSEETQGFKNAQEGFDFTNIKRQLQELVKTQLCKIYPSSCEYVELL